MRSTVSLHREPLVVVLNVVHTKPIHIHSTAQRSTAPQLTHSGNDTAINYRLKPDDLAYIFAHADVDAILVDAEFLPLLAGFAAAHPHVALIVDADAGADTGGYADAVRAGRAHDAAHGARGWAGLAAQADDEEALLALAYTSGTTARPKGVEYTHRGAYLAALGNVVEAGLAYHEGRCRYLWTLPMFHAMGTS